MGGSHLIKEDWSTLHGNPGTENLTGGEGGWLHGGSFGCLTIIGGSSI